MADIVRKRTSQSVIDVFLLLIFQNFAFTQTLYSKLDLEFSNNNELDLAENIYEQILATDKKNFNALYLLGTLKAQKNKNEEAIP